MRYDYTSLFIPNAGMFYSQPGNIFSPAWESKYNCNCIGVSPVHSIRVS